MNEDIRGGKMDITLVCYEENTRCDKIDSVIKILNGVQNYFYFCLEKRKKDICETLMVNWNKFCEDYPQSNNVPKIYITQKAFDDNWFLHANNKYSVITICDWEEKFAPPSLVSYLIYQIAQASLGFYAGLNEGLAIRLGHEENTEGCLFDFCLNKDDIKYGIAASRICLRCRGTLLQFGIEEKIIESIEKMLSYVRSEIIGKPMIFNSDAAFVVMKFSKNDENDNAYEYGIKAALNELNIECIRADKILNSGQLLEKIKKLIKENRFIIIKVDSENLNIYFELGFAMGINKEVLLISDEELLNKLPSDLKNLECLTYTRGNYRELKEKIIKYYQQNYHY